MWKWDVADPICSICQIEFEMPCPTCKFGGDDCSPIEGRCKHLFHMHCIYKWLERQAEHD